MHILILLTHILWFWCPFFTSSCLSFCWSLCYHCFHNFFLICVCVCVCVCAHACAHVRMCAKLLQPCSTLWPYRLQPASLLCPWDSPGMNSGVGCHALQGNFPTQGLTPDLISLALAGRFFTTSNSWEALLICILAYLSDFLPNCDFLFQIASCFFFLSRWPFDISFRIGLVFF